MVLETGFCPTIVVLATGQGGRFYGWPRAQRPAHDAGVLGATLRQAVASELPVLVVTTPALEPMARTLVAARDVVVLPDERAPGLGEAIAAGVGARPGASGWVVLPGDMPLVQPATLVAVAQALRGHAVTYAQHTGQRGHPVGFSAELYSELVHLAGDNEARRLVARYPSCGVDVDDPGTQLGIDSMQVLLDVDGLRPPEPRAWAAPPAAC